MSDIWKKDAIWIATPAGVAAGRTYVLAMARALVMARKAGAKGVRFDMSCEDASAYQAELSTYDSTQSAPLLPGDDPDHLGTFMSHDVYVASETMVRWQ